MSAEDNKELVRRLVEEGVRGRDPGVLDEIAAGPFAEVAKRCVAPFRGAFPDFEMEIVSLIAEGERVAAHFKCSGTHFGEWLGVPPTGRRFERVDEVYIFEVREGRLVPRLALRTICRGCVNSGSFRRVRDFPRPHGFGPRGSAEARVALW